MFQNNWFCEKLHRHSRIGEVSKLKTCGYIDGYTALSGLLATFICLFNFVDGNTDFIKKDLPLLFNT